MKIIAFYLPQFHEIPENNEWWGKGFTEWVNVRKAKPLFDGHYQPRIPLNNNYYNLLDKNVIEWQAKIARDNGVYGFCMYHYWFDGHMLLEKPMEILLNNPDIDINYCICWANENWTNAWVSSSSKTLISQTYGGEDEWERHYQYFKKFFCDKRYIKDDDMPLIVLYRPEIIPCLNSMIDYWRKRAVEDGFKGIKVAYQHVNFGMMDTKDDSRFDYQIEYQPAYARTELSNINKAKLRAIKSKVDIWMQKYMHRSLDLSSLKADEGPTIEDYDTVWKKILERHPADDKAIPGAFVDWDNSPRRGKTATVTHGATPEKFEKYLSKQIVRAKDIYKKDMLFLFAWNEWAEGGYLEPDQKYKDGYLKAIYNALKNTNEWVQDY